MRTDTTVIFCCCSFFSPVIPSISSHVNQALNSSGPPSFVDVLQHPTVSTVTRLMCTFSWDTKLKIRLNLIPKPAAMYNSSTISLCFPPAQLFYSNNSPSSHAAAWDSVHVPIIRLYICWHASHLCCIWQLNLNNVYTYLVNSLQQQPHCTVVGHGTRW